MSPERKASQALRNLCTFTAAKIVLSQLEGSGRGSLASYDTKVFLTGLCQNSVGINSNGLNSIGLKKFK